MKSLFIDQHRHAEQREAAVGLVFADDDGAAGVGQVEDDVVALGEGEHGEHGRYLVADGETAGQMYALAVDDGHLLGSLAPEVEVGGTPMLLASLEK